MRRIISYIAILFTFALGCLSCGISDVNERMKSKPVAFSGINEIVVVAEDDVWNSHVGDTIRYLFESYYPFTPSPEPRFDLRRFDVHEMNAEPLKKGLRTYLIVANLQDSSLVSLMTKNDLGREKLNRVAQDTSFRTSIGVDKWAQGQLLVYVFANGLDDLADAVGRYYSGIANRINAHDKPKLERTTYAMGDAIATNRKLKDMFGADFKIPADFVLIDHLTKDSVAWLRKDAKGEKIINIAIRKYPYKGPESVAKSQLIANFDKFGKAYVSSDNEGSYLVVNDDDVPVLDWNREIDGHYTKELRGLWEMERDFKGGPFMTYAMVNEDKQAMIQMDGFIMAIGDDKRDLMQQIDVIVKNTKWE